MAAKLIASGPTRKAARISLIKALEETALAGFATNRAFLIDALSHPDFAAGRATTAFIEESWPNGVSAAPAPGEAVALAAALALTADRDAAYGAAGLVGCDQLGWRSDGPAATPIELSLDGDRYEALATAEPTGWRVTVGEGVFDIDLTEAGEGCVVVNGRRRKAAWRAAAEGEVALSLGRFDGVFQRIDVGRAALGDAGSGAVSAPMPGLLAELLTAVGEVIEAGAPVAVMEAMKMRHRVLAGASGVVADVRVAAGDQLARGDLIAVIRPAEE